MMAYGKKRLRTDGKILPTDRYQLVDPDNKDKIIYNGVTYRIAEGKKLC